LSSPGEVTRLLADVGVGKEGADEALYSLVYQELHSLARRYMKGERAGHTLQTTALVNEAYVQLAGDTSPSWESRAHFMRVAARAMRRILIQHARRKGTEKRGGRWKRQTLAEVAGPDPEESLNLVRLDTALTKLASIEERMATVVELRFFAGLSIEDAARVLDVSPMTVKRTWRAAKAWLRTEMTEDEESDS
jgi:RNA polymerase sigma factor (TIGR02999 family)